METHPAFPLLLRPTATSPRTTWTLAVVLLTLLVAGAILPDAPRGATGSDPTTIPAVGTVVDNTVPSPGFCIDGRC